MLFKESKMASNNSTPIARNAHRRAIGTFPNRAAAKHALHELKDSGFPMDRVSVVAQDSKQNDTLVGADVSDRADNKADDGAKVGALSGGALGGLTGLLVGIGALAIPGIGPIMLAGAAATALASTVAGGAIGAVAGSLLGGLVGMGIPEERAHVYNDRVSAGEYLVMVDGTDVEIGRAEAILNHRGIEEWGVYDIPGNEAATVVQPTAVTAPPFEIARPVTPVASAPVLTAPLLADPLPVQPISTHDDDTIRLYEERLVVDKDRQKTGEVAIGKHIEVESASASVPIEKERIVIERVASGDTTAVTPGADAFDGGETIWMEVHEETPDIHKEAFVREEVSFRKEVIQETVNAEETVRREELDVDTQGRPVINDRY
jgi:uncharacterized protein (TIGR02271 family)